MGKKENFVRGLDYEETFDGAFGNFREFFSLNWLKNLQFKMSKFLKITEFSNLNFSHKTH